MTGIQTLDQFRVGLLRGVYQGHYQFVQDNFDFLRFGADADPNWVYWDNHVGYLDFALTHIESFFAAYLMLDDQESRDLFYRLMQYRCLGAPHLRIRDGFTWSLLSETVEGMTRYEVGPSTISLEGIRGVRGPLRHYENVPSDGEKISLDCRAGDLAYGLGFGDNRQYFYDRDGVNIRPEAGDFVIDGGACRGDTGVFFARAVGRGGRVFSFDPLPVHQEIIRHNIAQNGLTDNMFAIGKGLSDSTNGIPAIDPELADVASPAFSMLQFGDQVPAIALDDFVRDENIEKIDFIKLDVESFEMAAIIGARETISRFRPKLAISLYHQPQDFFEIPLYLKAHYPFYRLHLNHHTIHQEETVLYALAD